jgi:triphosphoribosyl-dephospho-CoA synthase
MPDFVAATVRWACRLDVQAAKPGNVSIAHPGHGMRAEDFLTSAEAIVAPLSAPSCRIGERIAAAVDATWDRVGMNTNLGIVLLAAPLAQAALTARPGETLERATGRVLAELDVDDAVPVFRTIVRANPAGLGEVDRHDVRGPVQSTLREAMQAAAHRDTIARQYANGFADVFGFGVPRFLTALERHGSEEHATVSCYLAWLVRFPDTHIARKHGSDVARQVSGEAVRLESAVNAGEDATVTAALDAWDASLKARGINPGTSADLTVASLLAARLQGAFAERFSEGGQIVVPVRKGTWMHGMGLRE